MNLFYDDPEDRYFLRIAAKISDGRYRYIGKGSGRIVYDMENGRVVKAAKNIRGLAQNMEEYRIAMIDDSGIFAEVYDISDDCRFLIMDKADRIGHISHVWDYFGVDSNSELFQVEFLQDISERYNLLIKDLGRAANWGIIDGEPKIIDYGFTLQVRKKYYPPR